MTNYQTLDNALWIPVQFALKQIANINVDKSMEKLRWLHEKLLRNTLVDGRESLHLTPRLTVTVHVLLEIFSGNHFDQVTPLGMSTLKKMHRHDYLEFDGQKASFPDSLNEYIASAIDQPKAEQGTGLGRMLRNENPFTYRNLYYLFDSVIGNKVGKQVLKVGKTPVTRLTSYRETNTNAPTYQTVFIWENEACRTHRLTRDGFL